MCASSLALASSLKLATPVHFDCSFAVLEYSETVQRIIHAMKYEGVSQLAQPTGDLLARKWQELADAPEIDFLTPVPLHPLRLRERGFNQAELIARRIAAVLDNKVLLALRRIRNTPQQAKFDRNKRLENVKGAFRIVPRTDLSGKTVAIVDDVLTTGSTINECAAQLSAAGAGRIIAFTIVRI